MLLNECEIYLKGEQITRLQLSNPAYLYNEKMLYAAKDTPFMIFS